MNRAELAQTAETGLARLRRLNRTVAMLVGVGLLLCAAFILADIVLRQFGHSFGGTDEISGYAMAIASGWGMAYAMLELGHVRIDLLRTRLSTVPRVLMDLFSLTALAVTVSVIAWHAWPVLSKSLLNDSRANTPLETPLWLVQLPWMAGWAWFCLMAWATLVAALALVWGGRWQQAEDAIGVFGEVDQVT